MVGVILSVSYATQVASSPRLQSKTKIISKINKLINNKAILTQEKEIIKDKKKNKRRKEEMGNLNQKLNWNNIDVFVVLRNRNIFLKE